MTTTQHTATVPSTSTPTTSVTDSFGPTPRRRPARSVRIVARVVAIVVAGIATGVAVHSLIQSDTVPSVPAMAEPNVAIVYSPTAQVAGQRASDAAAQVVQAPTPAQTDQAASMSAHDPTFALLFGTNWPLVSASAATLDGQSALFNLIFGPAAP
jgi:hypothetical protein